MDIGTEIKNQYRIVEHIGRGGMADVWSARDIRLNRMVAIKTIAHGLTGDIDPVKLFEREAQTIAQLEHPHILPIYDFGEYQAQLYIVMRYVTGGSLEDLLERGPMSPKEVLRMGEAIAGALDYAHGRKVIHLDLKPPNILLDSSNTPYLADFGLAAVLDPEGRAKNPGAGTLLYMAPEQLAADVLDHRADLYAFSIMLYHMLTGQLPFDATTSLALKQLQFQDEIPDLDQISPDLPLGLTYVLRRGTSLNAKDRPNSVGELIQEFRDVLMDSLVGDISTGVDMDSGFDNEFAAVGDVGELDVSDMLTEGTITDDMALLEAVDLYSRARHAWAGGRGRFLLGVTHFMLMSGYYMDAKKHGLSLDEPGMQMLLRGALEYDHEINFWWNKLNDTNRRWVCLHAIRSANAPTRIRALYRLETLPDADTPQIPKLVAQGLQVETNEQAKLAALQVLATRAKLQKPSQEYDIMTEFRGRMLTTMTRIGIQVRAPSAWQEVIYTPEIDLLLAEIALESGTPAVSEFAARMIGRIRSLTAVRHIAKEQMKGRSGALRALALVRDEAPTLPPVVSRQGRAYAWFANTWRRLFDHPLQLILRYLFALLGGTVAMGAHVFIIFRSEAIFTLQRWGNTLAMGLMFGVFTGFLVLFADEFSARLRGFWPWWTRLLVSGLLGWGLAILTWGQFHSFYLQQVPEWEVLRFAGFGLAFGFVMSALFSLRGWQAVLLTLVATYLPLNATFTSYQLYQLPVPLFAPIGLAIGIVVGFWTRRLNSFPVEWDMPWNGALKVSLSSLLGFAWALATWGAYLLMFHVQFVQKAAIHWDALLVLSCVSIVLGFIPTVFMNRANWLAFAATAVVSFALIYRANTGWFTTDDGYSVILPEPQLFILAYDYPEQIYTVAGLLALLVALGGYAFGLTRDVRVLMSWGRGIFAPKPLLVPQPAMAATTPEVISSPQLVTEADVTEKVSARPELVTERDPNAGVMKVDKDTDKDIRAGMGEIPLGKRQQQTELDPHPSQWKPDDEDTENTRPS